MGRGGLKKGTAGAPTYATDSTGQKDRHTFFSRHAPTMDRHDTEAHTSSVFPLSLPTRILSAQNTQTARSTHVPQPRARTPHRRSADSARRRAEPSLLSQVHAVLGRVSHGPCSQETESLAPSSVLESYLPPSQYGSPTGAQSDAESAPTLFHSPGSHRCRLLCNPPSRLEAALHSPFHSFFHSFIHPFLLVPPSFIHSPLPRPLQHFIHSFLHSFISPVLG